MQKINANILYDVPTIPNRTTMINTYVLVYTWATEFVHTKTLQFLATTNSLDVKVLGSVDNNTTCTNEAIPEFVVVPGSAEIKRVIDYYTHLRIYVKPHSSNVHGTLASSAAGSSSAGITLSDVVVGTVTFGGDLPDTAMSDLEGMRVDLDMIALDTAKLLSGDNVKASSISVTPATDIPATRQLGKVAIDQVTAHANEVIVVDMPEVVGTVAIDQVTSGANEVVVKTLPAQGQALMAGSMPVVLASNQSAISVVTTPADCSSIISGSKTVTSSGTPVPLGGAVSFKTLYVKACRDNNGAILIGNSTSQLYSIFAYESAIKFTGGSLDRIYIDTEYDGESVIFIGEA